MNCDIHWYEETMALSSTITRMGYEPQDGKHIIQRYTSGLDTAFDVLDILMTFPSTALIALSRFMVTLCCIRQRVLYCWVN